jgi:hypothetical protein
LDLQGDWNTEVINQLGRHPNELHEFVETQMRRAAAEAGCDANKFLALFERYVKRPPRENPELLRKSGWKEP